MLACGDGTQKPGSLSHNGSPVGKRKKTGASGRSVLAHLKVDLVISIHLSIALVNFLNKVIKTVLLQYDFFNLCVHFLIIILLI